MKDFFIALGLLSIGTYALTKLIIYAATRAGFIEVIDDPSPLHAASASQSPTWNPAGSVAASNGTVRIVGRVDNEVVVAVARGFAGATNAMLVHSMAMAGVGRLVSALNSLDPVDRSDEIAESYISDLLVYSGENEAFTLSSDLTEREFGSRGRLVSPQFTCAA